MLFLPVVIGDAATSARSMERQLHQALVSSVMDPCRIPDRASAAAWCDTTVALWSCVSLGLHSQRKEGVECFSNMTSLV